MTKPLAKSEKVKKKQPSVKTGGGEVLTKPLAKSEKAKIKRVMYVCEGKSGVASTFVFVLVLGYGPKSL